MTSRLCIYKSFIATLLITIAIRSSSINSVEPEFKNTLIFGALCGLNITNFVFRDEIASNKTVQRFAHKINMSPQDLILSACYASNMLGLGASTFFESPVIKTGLYINALAPFIIGTCMPNKVSQWIGKRAISRLFKPLSQHSHPLVNCPNEECPGFCEKCKVQRLYQGTTLGVLATFAGMALDDWLRYSSPFSSIRQRMRRTWQEPHENNNSPRSTNNINSETQQQAPEDINELILNNRNPETNLREECIQCSDPHSRVIQVCPNAGQEQVHAICRHCVLGQWFMNNRRCPLCRNNAYNAYADSAIQAAQSLNGTESSDDENVAPQAPEADDSATEPE